MEASNKDTQREDAGGKEGEDVKALYFLSLSYIEIPNGVMYMVQCTFSHSPFTVSQSEFLFFFPS